MTGLQYFTGASIDDLAEENDQSIKEVQENVRAYVGSRLSEFDLEDVELDIELSETPPNPLTEALREFDFTPVVPSIAELVQPISFQTQQIAQQLTALPDYSEITSNSLAPIQNMIQQEMFNISQTLQETLKPLQELREQYREIEESDFEFKWLRNVSHYAFFDLYEIYDEQGNEAAAELLAAQLRSEEGIKDFKEYFASFEEYSERQPIVDEALNAHAEGRYALSIPTLLSQLDGIFIDTALELGLYTEDDDPIGVEVVNTGEGSPQYIPEIRDEYRRYYASVLWGRRVEILHGKDTDFSDDEFLSAKLIWFFFQTLHTVENIQSAEHIGDYHITRVIQQQDGCSLETVVDCLPYQEGYVADRVRILRRIDVVEEEPRDRFRVTEKGILYLDGDLSLDYEE